MHTSTAHGPNAPFRSITVINADLEDQRNISCDKHDNAFIDGHFRCEWTLLAQPRIRDRGEGRPRKSRPLLKSLGSVLI